MKKEIIINGNDFSDRIGFDLEIKKKFTKDIEWVDYSASKSLNLDSVNDFLRGGFKITEYEEPIKLKWINFEKSKKDLGKEETLLYLEDVLKKCAPSNAESIKRKIILVKEDKGTLLYEEIINLIREHKNIELVLE